MIPTDKQGRGLSVSPDILCVPIVGSANPIAPGLSHSCGFFDSNLLQQQFTADQPNQRWVSDVSCFKLRDHYLYVCVIIDLFSRKVIAYKISKKNSTQLITAAFKMAYEERDPPAGLIFHSDRGAQYTSHRFQKLLHEHNVTQSFSRPGEPHDNAVAESFFASLKKEELYRRNITSDRAFQASAAFYIEQERQMRHQCSNRLAFSFSTSI